MAKPRLVRTSARDDEKVRGQLRESAVAAQHPLGERTARVWLEPLLRSDGSGGLLQSVRVSVPGADPAALRRAFVRSPHGGDIRCEVEPGPEGSTRLLVPAVEAPVPVRIGFPDLAPGEAIELELLAQRAWTIHLIHHSHLDIGYTDPQGAVLREHVNFLDDLLDLTTRTDDWPEEAKFRWAVEALLSFEKWAWARPHRVEEFLRRVREGRIELTAMPFNMHTEVCSVDELHELLRRGRRLSEEHGVRITSAMQSDVPGAVAGLPDALSASGVEYLSVAHNWAGRSVPHLVGGAALPRLFRWRSPAGSSVLVWMTDTPNGLAYMEGPLLGFHESYAAVDDLLPAYLTALATKPYPYQDGMFGWPFPDAPVDREPYPWDLLHLRVQGRFGDNAPPRMVIAETVRRWNETWAYPKLRLSRNEDFFAEAEERYGSRIAVFEGDWNNWWVEGAGSSARGLQLGRAAQSAAADAQTFGAMSGILGAPGAAEDTAEAEPVYASMALFDEHTWGAADPWTVSDSGTDSGQQQWQWKIAHAVNAHDDAAALLDRAAVRLGSRLGTGPDALLSFHVANSTVWRRGDLVRFFVPEAAVPLELPLRLADARDGRSLAFDTEYQTNEDHRAAGRFLIAAVDEVPPLGAVRVDVLAAAGTTGTARAAQPEDPASAEAGTVLENPHLRVAVDPRRACVTSIVDKATGRELVNTDATFGFNAYVYDRYGSAGGFNHQSSKTFAFDEHLNLLTDRAVAEHAAVIDRRRTATADVLVLECAAPGTRLLRTTLRLPHGQARLDIENRVAKDATMVKESGYFAFPFAQSEPVVRVEVTGGVTGTGLPAVPGGAGHMRAMRRWVALEEDGLAVAVASKDAPLVQIGDIHLPYAPFPGTLPEHEEGTVFSWVHNNLWDTNFPSEQAFEMTFAYSVAAERTSRENTASVLGARTAAPGSRPLRAVRAGGREAAAAQWSLAEVSDPRVRLIGATTPRPGRTLLRLQSFAEEPVTIEVRCGFAFTTAHSADLLGAAAGEPLESAGDTVRVSVPPLASTAVLVSSPSEEL